MAVLLQIIITAGAALIAQKFLPWWSIAISSAFVSLCFSRSNAKAIFASFVGVAILWTVYPTIIDISTSSILTKKMVVLFSPYMSNIAHPIILTGFIGGLVGGISGLTGYRIKKAFFK